MLKLHTGALTGASEVLTDAALFTVVELVEKLSRGPSGGHGAGHAVEDGAG